ncbi:hypothetical protein HYFRA_00001658 [Hymenoscyphus fraxineus]|uniref:ubiquitinyl hydrolase 1 n=1 Tax=Hymenoscyphus fraxineus TaxID=746836 RepID=A0A9N9PZI4_9HELO|nr:hypothetical protein HYFRA_00001658 [Hymenoscyphus fraxineus]
MDGVVVDEDAPFGLPLDYIINHVFLPPKLPQSNDSTTLNEVALTKLFHETLKSFIDHLPEEDQNDWIPSSGMLDTLLDDGNLGTSFQGLSRVLLTTSVTRTTDVLALHITHQNAGLVVRRKAQDFTFEAFELSPTTQAVTGTMGRLVRRFPGPVIAIPHTLVHERSFRKALAHCLASLEQETPDDAKCKGVGIQPDTVSPQFVTEWLPGILRAFGSPFEVPRIYKRTRDEVLGAGDKEPWRRSPRWTLLRVALQTTLASPEGGHQRYKLFMIYFMATVLDRALGEGMWSSDLIHVMLAKLNRRIQKLDLVIPDDVPWADASHEFVTETMESARKELAKRWSTIQRASQLEGKFSLAELKKLKPHWHTVLRLPSLRPFLEKLHRTVLLPRDGTAFDGKCQKRIDGRDRSLPDPESLGLTSQFDIRLSLMDLEHWASHSLNSWFDRHKNSASRLVKLAKVIDWYKRKAHAMYMESPENFSVMVLTLLHLWTALDKGTIFLFPLLKKFDHELPMTLLDSLLLPKRHQMTQLRDIEKHLLQRKENCLPTNPSVFGDISSPSSFGAQYYDQSPAHKTLKISIENGAKHNSERRKAELKHTRARYDKLMEKSNKLTCQTTKKWCGRGRNQEERTIHAPHCEKCQIRKTAQSLKVECHEWPLPPSESAAKSVVYELDIPDLLRVWRSTTYQILADILSPTPPAKNKPKGIALLEYEGLLPYVESQPDRLRLVSPKKPSAQALPVFEATEDAICLSNRLTFTMQDVLSQTLATEHLKKLEIRDRCTLKLPPGCYETLQYAVDGTTHTSNEVIARQALCPNGLTVHELHAFAALRSGHRLQWFNIARELVARTLNFGVEEVHLLVLQSSWQAGPAALHQTSRDSHVELEEEDFGKDLLSSLESGLKSVESNWQGSISALTFISLASRLLSISLHESVREGSLEFLQKSRDVTIQWLRTVVELLHASSDEEEIAYLTLRALDLSLICHCTFDVDRRLLPSVLSSSRNVAMLIETATVVKDRTPVLTTNLRPITRSLLSRFYRTSHAVERTLKAQILASPDGINQAIKQLWEGYVPGTPWSCLEEPNDRWLKTETAPSENGSPMTVHFNTLSGELLINGAPLTRMPKEYEENSTYQTLFGNKILEVVPSSRGLHFETRNSVHGFQVHFAMFEGELVVRAADGYELYEVIPLHALETDFPRTFVKDYVHWMNRGNGSIEWRPLETKWTPSSDNWRILTPENPNGSLLTSGSHQLVDIASDTAAKVYKWLKPIEHRSNINILYNVDTGEAEIRLPRMNLDFVLSKSGLESKQFRGMVVDTIQYMGTLHGLQNKLILKDIQRKSRIAIVPQGTVSHSRTEHHVQVFIETGENEKVSYHQFLIDTDLCQLTDNGNLNSRLFRVYLHALTSHCLPDTLTSRTGTEEALHGLRLASTRSFVSLDQEHVDQLKLIAKLTPFRDYSPKGSKFMQIVHWENLSPLSQHEDFVKEARLMMAQAQSLRQFTSTPADLKYKVEARGSSELRVRAAMRNAFFRVHPFGAEKFHANSDVSYAGARDSIFNSVRELEACKISTMVDKWSCRLDPISNLSEEIKNWAAIGGMIYGKQARFEFGFDERWLDNPRSFMAHHWCTFHESLSKSNPSKDKLRISIFLATLTQSKWGNSFLAHTLLAFATNATLRNIQPPSHDVFDLSRGHQPDERQLKGILAQCKVPFQDSPEMDMARLPNEHDEDFRDRREAAYQAAAKIQLRKCLRDLTGQWPIRDVLRPKSVLIQTYLPTLPQYMPEIKDMFQHWYKNLEFENYIQEVQDVLDSLARPLNVHENFYSIPPQEDLYQRAPSYLKIDDLLKNPAPQFGLHPDQKFDSLVAENDQALVDAESSKLKSLLTRLSRSATGHYQQMYIRDLRRSYNALLTNSPPSHQLRGSPQAFLKEHLIRCRGEVNSLYDKIRIRLIVSSTPAYEIARSASMLPRLSASILLRLLARFTPVALSPEWKAALVHYALAIACMQKAERLVACGKREADILNELTNVGHTNWDPMEFPEWLLLELESNILIRPEQAQIAREMIDPRSGFNSIMQLNMGLGKSSVIVPIVSATLADRSKLARVIVLKSLSEQMFQLLVEKLGGLIGRRIYRLPVSRSLKPSFSTAALIQKTYEECMSCGGILLVEPETILSFELLGIDHLLSQELNPPEPEETLVTVQDDNNADSQDSMHSTGRQMVHTQNWLYKNARDILDESDEILSVRFELIYTLGIQQNIQFSPDRWVAIQHVLGVVSAYARELSTTFPRGIEVIEGKAGAFPRIRILEETAGKSLLKKSAESICRDGMSSLAMWTYSSEEREVIFEYITNLQITKERATILEYKVFQTEFTRMTLLLLRGLFAVGVLEFVFAKKRWRVNYGLSLSRSMLAVPYHAKDNPSARSEFSHPDTAISLTCLSYYYAGLTDAQIHASFEELFLSDHAQEDYVRWIQGCEIMPNAFKQLAGVNLRDKQQCSQELFPWLRYSKGLIDYYLEHLVFPKEMKEFSNKLSSSGWEIARQKTHPTTGFSGTNDSKYMLPTPIKQCELPEQLSTNADVLTCLLRPENVYNITHLEALDVSSLLSVAVAMDPAVRVLLDVGAQLLEDNEAIASSWLEKVAAEDADAVIFFQDNDLFVLNREGSKEPLLVSPFLKQMERCIVYLDEVHTRGTDLKMPADYRAICTLGPDLTKDRLAQACKRLRKLGKGQSVVFVAPLEVQSKILECCGKHDATTIEVEDVLLWTIQNSWEFTKKGMPLWATQGMRHYRRAAACDLSGDEPQIPIGILEKEAMTLDERYGLDRKSLEEGVVCRGRFASVENLARGELASIRAKCREFGLSDFGDSDLHEEQERELHPENEREQQVEPPVPARAYRHTVHENIRRLVRTGQLLTDEGVFPAFQVFGLTRARDLLDLNHWSSDLGISHDFLHTVQIPNEGNKDSFLRPVHWVLSFKGPHAEEKYLILSPYEVHELLPHIRGSNRVRLHVYTARLSLSNRSLESLSFCAVPPVPGNWIIPKISTQLNLFAGQLYLRDEAEYQTLCRFLGLRFKHPYQGVEVGADGFIAPESRQNQDAETAAVCKFERSPIDFLRLVTGFRRLGQSFTNSHMGRIFSGELVWKAEFERVAMRNIKVDNDDGDAMDLDGDTIIVDSVVVKMER